MNAENRILLSRKAQVIDGLVTRKLANPIKTASDGPPVAALMRWVDGQHSRQLLLFAKTPLAANGVLWVTPDYGSVDSHTETMNRVTDTLAHGELVIPERTPFEEIPGYLIDDGAKEHLLFGVTMIPPLAERKSNDVYLATALHLAGDVLGPISIEDRMVATELLGQFPIP